MYEERILSYVRTIMKNLNLLIVAWISSILCLTTYRIADAGQATEFIVRVGCFPTAPWKIPLLAVSFFIILLLVMHEKKADMKRERDFFLYALVESAICLIIMWALNFAYNSIILLIIADLLRYWKNSKSRILVLGVLFSFYIFTDASFFQSSVRIISLDVYLAFYNAETQAVIIAVKSILNSLNIFAFMFYMMLLIRVLGMENERIRILNQRLDIANAQLKKYALKTEKMTETRERNRLAREIHDTIGHSLIGIIAGIDASRRLLDESADLARQQLEAVADVARNGMNDVRRSVKALRPDVLEKNDLEEAIQQVVEEMKQVSGADIFLNNRAGRMEFQEDEEEAIYRIVQESLTNAIRHGKADKIWIGIERINNIVTVEIKDNGAGCKEIEEGFGLKHMAERLEMLNGSLSYSGDDGFMITARIPLRWGK